MRLLQAQRSHSQIKMQFKTEEIVAQLHDELEGWLYKFNPHIDKKDRSGLRYASFVVEYGSQLALSAADHVHIIWAHLTDAAAVTACTQQLAGFWCAAPDVGVAMCDRFLPVSRAAVEVEWTLVQFACLQATVQPCGCDVSTFVAPHQAEPLATHPRHFLLLPSSRFRTPLQERVQGNGRAQRAGGRRAGARQGPAAAARAGRERGGPHGGAEQPHHARPRRPGLLPGPVDAPRLRRDVAAGAPSSRYGTATMRCCLSCTVHKLV